MKKIIVLFVVLFVIIFANCYVSAGVTNALKEINEVKVLVENLPDVFTKAGLTRSEFQTTAELFLRRTGIKVVYGESYEYHSTPYLYINIHGLPIKNIEGIVTGYVYKVYTDLKLGYLNTEKYGTLYGTTIIHTPAILGYAGKINNVRENIKTFIRQGLEKIANLYLKAHQEKIKE